MTAHQEALFQTPEEEREQRLEDYLRSLPACPFCGKDESSPWLYVNNHGFFGGRWPKYPDGSHCARLQLLANQAEAAAKRGDEATVFDRWTEITRYRINATRWPEQWFDELEAELRAAGVLV